MLDRIKELFGTFVPPARPQVELGFCLGLAVDAGVKIDKEACIINLRGFYSVGSLNQRGIYDDAGILLTPEGMITFNINTDPGKYQKSIATLVPGVWRYKVGIHGLSKPKAKQYKALVQAAPVTVRRDDVGLDTGWFGINYHRGGYTGTSSLGCQTVYPSQYDEFLAATIKAMSKYKQEEIKVILREI